MTLSHYCTSRGIYVRTIQPLGQGYERAEVSIVELFIQVVDQVIFRPKSFFRNRFEDLSVSFSLLFGVIVSGFSLFLTAGVTFALKSLSLEPVYVFGGSLETVSDGNSFGNIRLILVVLLAVLLVLFVLLWLLLKSLIIHIVLIFSGSENKQFHKTFKVVCLCTPAKFASVVPVGGLLIALIWDLFLVIRGLREAHGIPFAYSAVAAMVPTVLLIIS